MSQICVVNFLLNDRAISVQTKLNAGSRLRLYREPVGPSPANTLANYLPFECTFDTYSIQALNPNWGPPTKVQDGEYHTMSGTVTYPGPVTTANEIFGLFVDDGAGNLLFSQQFDTPINFPVGSPPLTLQIGYEVWAKFIVP